MSPRTVLTALAVGLAACAEPQVRPLPPPSPLAVAVPPPVAPAPSPAPPAPEEWRAVFHLSDAARPANARGLQNALNAIKALGDVSIRFVLVVHGPALEWFRRAEPDNLGEPLSRLLATGYVELRVCARTLEENHWTLADLVPGAKAVPSGSLEVLRLQREGFAYFKP